MDIFPPSSQRPTYRPLFVTAESSAGGRSENGCRCVCGWPCPSPETVRSLRLPSNRCRPPTPAWTPGRRLREEMTTCESAIPKVLLPVLNLPLSKQEPNPATQATVNYCFDVRLEAQSYSYLKTVGFIYSNKRLRNGATMIRNKMKQCTAGFI